MNLRYGMDKNNFLLYKKFFGRINHHQLWSIRPKNFKVKNCFLSSSMNDGEFINYYEPQMLLKCCLIHIYIILPWYVIIYFFRLCLRLSLLMSFLCDLFFITIFIFITINHIISLKQIHFQPDVAYKKACSSPIDIRNSN